MRGTSAFLAVLLLMLLAIQNSSSAFAAEEEDAKWAIADAEKKIMDCYEAVAEADEAGANVTDLLTVMGESGWLLFRARSAYGYGDFVSALNLSGESVDGLEGLVDEAWTLREEASERGYWDFMVYFVGSLVGGGLVVACGFLVWFRVKRRFGAGRLEEYGLLFVVLVGVLALVVASPGLSRLLVYPRSEFFTEFWVLDADGKAENYPFNISSGEEYEIILGIGNQLGYCGYYVVEVKFRNESMPAPDRFNFTRSSLQPLMNISAFVQDEDVWELPLQFSLEYGHDESASKVEVDSFSFNNVELMVGDYVLGWDEEKQAFLGDLFFELWILNGTTSSFEYHKRFLSLKVNLTVSHVRFSIGSSCEILFDKN